MACTYLSIMVNFFCQSMALLRTVFRLRLVLLVVRLLSSRSYTRYHMVGPTRARIGLYEYSVLCSSHLCRAKFLDLVVRVRDIQVILSGSTLTMRALYHVIVCAVIHSHSWYWYQV